MLCSDLSRFVPRCPPFCCCVFALICPVLSCIVLLHSVPTASNLTTMPSPSMTYLWRSTSTERYGTGGGDVLTLAHFPGIQPVVTKQDTRNNRVRTECTAVPYARERYSTNSLWYTIPDHPQTKEYQENTASVARMFRRSSDVAALFTVGILLYLVPVYAFGT